LLLIDNFDLPVCIYEEKGRILNDTLISPDKKDDLFHGTYALRLFLEALVGGKSLVFLAARQKPEWINEGFSKELCLHLPQSQREDALVLGERVLGRQQKSDILRDGPEDGTV
jgi:hypothetical protein